MPPVYDIQHDGKTVSKKLSGDKTVATDDKYVIFDEAHPATHTSKQLLDIMFPGIDNRTNVRELTIKIVTEKPKLADTPPEFNYFADCIFRLPRDQASIMIFVPPKCTVEAILIYYTTDDVEHPYGKQYRWFTPVKLNLTGTGRKFPTQPVEMLIDVLNIVDVEGFEDKSKYGEAPKKVEPIHLTPAHLTPPVHPVPVPEVIRKP